MHIQCYALDGPAAVFSYTPAGGGVNDEERVAVALVQPAHQAAVASTDVGAIVRIARRALGLTQHELAQRVGWVSQATISRLERASTRAASDAVLLAALADALCLDPRLLGLDGLAPGRRGSTVPDVQRRDFMLSAAATAAAALLPSAITRAVSIGADDIAHAWRSLQRLFDIDDLRGGLELHEVAGSMARTLGHALRTARVEPGSVIELQRLTATAMEHAGWLSFDAGRGTAARAWWLETIHLARDIGSVPGVHCAALASMSLQASTASSTARDAASLAQAAERAVEAESGPTLHSLLAAREAVGHALVGDRVEARRAIARSHVELDRSTGRDLPLWLTFWGSADLAMHESRVAAALGDIAAGEAAARTALAAADEVAFPRNHMIYSIRLSGTLVRAGKLDEAVEVARGAVTKAHLFSGSQRIVREVDETLHTLGAQRYRPARDFAEAARRLVPTT